MIFATHLLLRITDFNRLDRLHGILFGRYIDSKSLRIPPPFHLERNGVQSKELRSRYDCLVSETVS